MDCGDQGWPHQPTREELASRFTEILGTSAPQLEAVLYLLTLQTLWECLAFSLSPLMLIRSQNKMLQVLLHRQDVRLEKRWRLSS